MGCKILPVLGRCILLKCDATKPYHFVITYNEKHQSGVFYEWFEMIITVILIAAMKHRIVLLWLSFFAFILSAGAQENERTLLWEISGKGISRPSYLFGTMHLLCEDDAGFGEAVHKALDSVDELYLEADLSNPFEIFSAVSQLTMRGDTTLKDLLTEKQYRKVKEYFKDKSIFPFFILEKMKPMLAVSLIQQDEFPCDKVTIMEQLLMQEAKKRNKKMKGLETFSYQASMLDEIPYKYQAEQLVNYIEKQTDKEESERMLKILTDAYLQQDLKKLDSLLFHSEFGVAEYADVLLYRRNEAWAKKLDALLSSKSLFIAVGAGHLPGERGLISLLRKKGYIVRPLSNPSPKVKVL
ncbi:MAG: TraB/GumN family protein [Chitinophagaceae bacterium]|nr:TraB/GumN family protein [Chitinophagaceae bacterium]